MKSSTLHRSNLTKERMELLREIKAQMHHSTNDTSPGIYVRPAKEQELDVLWQSFKVNSKKERTSSAYIVAGFAGGVLAMFLLTVLVSFATHMFNSDNVVIKSKEVAKEVSHASVSPKVEREVVSFLPPDTAAIEVPVVASAPRFEQYTIKAGDTLDQVAYRFYGKYDTEKIKKIAEVNNIVNPHRISIGQVINIPIE